MTPNIGNKKIINTTSKVALGFETELGSGTELEFNVVVELFNIPVELFNITVELFNIAVELFNIAVEL